jgi:hypothetical protein
MMDVSRRKSVDTLRGNIRNPELFKDHARAGLLQTGLCKPMPWGPGQRHFLLGLIVQTDALQERWWLRDFARPGSLLAHFARAAGELEPLLPNKFRTVLSNSQ